MNPAIDRRKLLTSAAVGGATIVGASALGALDATAAFAEPTPSVDPAIDKSTFIEGRITGIKNGMLDVTSSEGELHRLQITNGTSVWKVHATSIDAIDVGDGLYARGVEMPDGSIAADAVWVNIVNMACTVRAISRDRLALDHGHNAVIGRVLDGTTTISYQGGAQTNDMSGLRIGQAVQVLGAWRPSDDSIDMVTMWTGH